MSDVFMGILLMSVAVTGMGAIFGYQNTREETDFSENSIIGPFILAFICYHTGVLLLHSAAMELLSALKGLPAQAVYAITTTFGGGLALVLAGCLWHMIFTGFNWLAKRRSKKFVPGE